MTSKIWAFGLEDGPHSVQLEQDAWTGRRTITVDGSLIQSQIVLFSRVTTPRFPIAGHNASLHFRGTGFSANYELQLDGRSIGLGRDAPPSRVHPIPAWTWFFVAVCAAIPVIALGGLIPFLLGVSGAAICVAIARDPSRVISMRILFCVGVTICCWALFIFLLITAAASNA